MSEKMKKFSFFLMVLGFICVISAAIILIYSEIEERNAGKFSQQIVSAFVEQMMITEDQIEDAEDSEGMDFLTIDGQNYIGILLIPQLELELPVANECTSALLKDSPCAFEGSILKDDLIIAGHNYKAHFGNLGELVIGDEINLVDPSGNVYTYSLIEQEVISGDDLSNLEAGQWDLTLFTCLYANNTKRVVLRFKNTLYK